MWLATLNRLSTRDRLQNWGVTSDSACLLCSAYTESHPHLFFSCPFSQEVWSSFSPSTHPFPLTFTLISAWIPSLQPRIRHITKLIFQACVYYLWRERNNRLFNAESATSNNIISEIFRTLRNKLYILDRADEQANKNISSDSNIVLWYRHFHPPPPSI